MADPIPNDRGQVGIGTLIVFIAMVLVAAIAAGVLINTAGFLQTQAEDTGTESTEQVANNLNVITEVGTVTDDPEEDADRIDEVLLGVQPAAGSDDVNLEELSLQYVSDESFSNIVHLNTIDFVREEGANFEDGTIVGENSVFNTEPVTAEDGEDNVMTDNADRYDIVISLDDEQPFGDVEEENVNDDLSGVGVEDNQVVVAEEDELLEAEDTGGSIVETRQTFDAIDVIELDDAVSVEDFDDGVVIEDAAFDAEVDETETPDEIDVDEEATAISAGFVEELNNGDDELAKLNEGEEAELTFTTETGAQTITILQVPDSLAGDGEGDTVDL